MKRYIIVVAVIVAIAGGLLYGYFYKGLYLFPHNSDSNAAVEEPLFTQEDKVIYKRTNGELEPFEIKGIDLVSSQPGSYATDYAISKETYLRWFQSIKDMGANCIRVYVLHTPVFYDAFYEFNKDNPDPLYLVHGVWVEDYANNSHMSAFNPGLKDTLKDNIKTMIDVIHGNRMVELGRVAGSGSYTHDISDWVIGYILGYEWDMYTVKYTDLIDDHRTSYQGEYLYTVEGASPFEVFLAEVGDDALRYETNRYHEQKLIAFANWPQTDPNEYSDAISQFFLKFSTIDIEHIKKTPNVKSGIFVAYHVYPYYPDYYRFVPEFMEKTDPYGNVNTFYTYLTELVKHHNIPVVVAEFGIPTSRTRATEASNGGRHQGQMTEEEQGLAIAQCIQDIEDAGCAGCFIYSWQDEWYKHTSTTWAYTDTLKNPFWSNAQAPEQGFGLLTFDPGTDESVSYVDGDVSEWADDSPVAEDDGLELYLKYDEKYLYFMVTGQTVSAESPIFIPIDTTQNSGSKTVEGSDLQFDRDADFLLILDGEDNSHLLVQERYEVIRAASWSKISEIDAYSNVPHKNTSKFKPIYAIIETNPLVVDGMSISDLLNVNLHDLVRMTDNKDKVYETGKLIYGNGNPNSEDFNSLADFIYGDHCVEVRIPWELLNFSNPSEMQIHDDYYERYGVENMTINSLWVGVGNGSSVIPMYEFPLKQWGRDVTYHERLKESYYTVKSVWTGEKTTQQLLEEAKASGNALDLETPVQTYYYSDLYYPDANSPVVEDPTNVILQKALG